MISPSWPCTTCPASSRPRTWQPWRTPTSRCACWSGTVQVGFDTLQGSDGLPSCVNSRSPSSFLLIFSTIPLNFLSLSPSLERPRPRQATAPASPSPWPGRWLHLSSAIWISSLSWRRFCLSLVTLSSSSIAQLFSMFCISLLSFSASTVALSAAPLMSSSFLYASDVFEQQLGLHRTGAEMYSRSRSRRMSRCKFSLLFL